MSRAHLGAEAPPVSPCPRLSLSSLLLPKPRQFIPAQLPRSHFHFSSPVLAPRIPWLYFVNLEPPDTAQRAAESGSQDLGSQAPGCRVFTPGRFRTRQRSGHSDTCGSCQLLLSCPLPVGLSLLPVSCGYPTPHFIYSGHETQQTLSYHVAVKQKLPPNLVVNGLGGSDMPVWAPDGDRCRAVGGPEFPGCRLNGASGNPNCLKMEASLLFLWLPAARGSSFSAQGSTPGPLHRECRAKVNTLTRARIDN